MHVMYLSQCENKSLEVLPEPLRASLTAYTQYNMLIVHRTYCPEGLLYTLFFH